MDDTTIIIIGVAVFCLFFMVSCCKAYAQRKSSETETSATVTTVTRVRRHRKFNFATLVSSSLRNSANFSAPRRDLLFNNLSFYIFGLR
jgi:hypothetical protein